jgi:hypothetical protein
MLKDLLLQKGWAGKTISRAETVDRVNPVIHRLIALNQHYDAFLRSSREEGLDAELASLQKTARADVGKLAETVFSCGGTPYNGTDLEPSSFAVDNNQRAALTALRDLETSFVDFVADEVNVEHQMRTRAILAVVKANAETRLKLLQEHIR